MSDIEMESFFKTSDIANNLDMPESTVPKYCQQLELFYLVLTVMLAESLVPDSLPATSLYRYVL
ncbi:hypothetical protein OKW24_005646 [Peribacillus simplex]|nr:hypothetical protein [Peribacillus simplex]MDF9763750.1 hypothetical protein [Peribacillus simplex]